MSDPQPAQVVALHLDHEPTEVEIRDFVARWTEACRESWRSCVLVPQDSLAGAQLADNREAP